MKCNEFIVDKENKTIVLVQCAHDEEFKSVSKTCDTDHFNIGVGQLIVMKRNEIQIRKRDIEKMRTLLKGIDAGLDCTFEYEIDHKLLMNFKQITTEKINASLNHIRELKEDLNALYYGNYNVMSYTELVAERKGLKSSGVGSVKYTIPEEIDNGTHVYAFVNGQVTIVPVEKMEKLNSKQYVIKSYGK